MPILLTSDRDGFTVSREEAQSLLAAGAAVVDMDDGWTTTPPTPRKESHGNQ
jgi:hypothetical protein